MKESIKMVFDDPSKFHLLADEVKKDLIQGGINTVDIMAGRARKKIRQNIAEKFTDHNNFIANSVLFTPATRGAQKLNEIVSFVGITEKASFMKRQEEGGWHTPKAPATKLKILTDAGKQGDIPTIHVGKRGKQTITGKATHMILLKGKRRRGKSHKADRVARAAMANKTGLLMYFGPNNNIFKVTDFHVSGGTRGVPRSVKFKIKMYFNRRHEKTYTKPTHFFTSACEEVAKDVQKIFNSQMKKLGL